MNKVGEKSVSCGDGEVHTLHVLYMSDVISVHI